MIHLDTRTAYIESGEGKCIDAKRKGNKWEVKIYKKGRLVKTLEVKSKKDIKECC